MIRFHLEKQEAALDRLYFLVDKCQWISRIYQKKKKKKFNANFQPARVRCTNAVKITITSTKNLHVDLRDNYGTPYLMTSRTSTDPLESDFNVIKGTQWGRIISKEHLHFQDIFLIFMKLYCCNLFRISISKQSNLV